MGKYKMNLKNNEFLMLVVAFLLGYFANRILKGCRTVEGIDNEDKKLTEKKIILFKKFVFVTLLDQ